MATVTSLGFSIFTTYNGRGARKASSELQRVADVAKGVASTATAVMGAASAAAGIWAASAAKAGLDSNALMQRTNMALETLLGSAEAAQAQLAELREFGKESPIALPVWVRAQQQMIAFGIEVDRVIPMLGAIQDAVAAAGGTEEEINGAVRALSQMASKGKLSAEELQQLGERGIDAAGLVALAWGTTAGDIREQITAGTIEVEDFFEGFIKGSEMAFGGAAEGLKETYVGMIDRLRAAHRRIGEVLMTPLVDPQGGGAFIELGNAVSDGLNHIEEEIRPFAEQMKSELAPAIDSASDSIREFFFSIETEDIQKFVNEVEELVPAASAVAAALGTKALGGMLGGIPVLGAFAGALSPVIVGLGVLSALSPELRADVALMLDSFTPLIPVVADLAAVALDILVPAVQAIVPVFTAAGTAAGFLVENIDTAPVKFAALVAVMLGIASAAGMVGPGLGVAAVATGALATRMSKLRTAMIAHPITTLAVGLAATGVALDYFNDKVDEAYRYQVDFNNSLGGAFTEAAASGGSALSGLRTDFDELVASLKYAEDAIVGFKQENALGFEYDVSDQLVFSGEDVISADEMAEINEQVNELDQALTRAYESGMSEYQIMQILRNEFGATSEEIEYLLPLLDGYQAATAAAAVEQQQLQIRTSEATAAIIEQADELRAQNDPLFALVKAQQDLAESQTAVNDAVAEFGADSPEAIAASLEAADALLAYTDAGANASTVLGNQLTPSFLAAADAAGFTDEVIGILTGQVQNATDEFIDFADDYEATVSVSGTGAVVNAAQRVQQWLNNIDRTVRISFEYENFAPINGIAIPRAHGGPIIGPGTGTSDSVPVMASNGEFMITAKRVREIGGFGAVEKLLRYASGDAGGGTVSSAPSNYGSYTGVAAARVEQNHFHFHGPVASERQAEDMVVKALTSARRKGRIKG